jgi:tRNA A-37 threonylcarbamoyl transferase component Bud32
MEDISNTDISNADISNTPNIGLKQPELIFYLDETFCYVKENVSIKEYKIHKYISDIDIVNIPKIYSYDKHTKIMIMQKINNMCISDQYGNNLNEIPFDKIRNIIKILFDHNIEYPDITGYNFIEKNDKIWIIDFEHARYVTKRKNAFIQKFINGKNCWNPNYL